MSTLNGIKWLLGITAICFACVFNVSAALADQIVIYGKIAVKHVTSRSSDQDLTLLLPQLRHAKGEIPIVRFDSKSFYKSSLSNPMPEGIPGVSGYLSRDARAFGTDSVIWPYSTARVANSSSQPDSEIESTPVTGFPYRATGKLYVRHGEQWQVCTASLIKKSVLITAAHCVHKFGQGNAGLADQVLWAPANTDDFNNPGPWGFYEATSWLVPKPYFNGTDTCTHVGVICNNDIATVVLLPKNGTYAGNKLGGWYSYGWDGYSFAKSPTFGGSTVASITQLGYPVTFDDGYQMQRNDSFGKYVKERGGNGKWLQNVQLGSPMLGGASGGPWLVNFGTEPDLAIPATMGKASIRNTVVGVSSWAYPAGTNILGTSWFGKNAEFQND